MPCISGVFAFCRGCGWWVDEGFGGVYLWWWGPCLVCLRGPVGTGESLQGWRIDVLGLTDAHRVLLNSLLLFLLHFFLYHTLYSFIFTHCNIAEMSDELN